MDELRKALEKAKAFIPGLELWKVEKSQGLNIAKIAFEIPYDHLTAGEGIISIKYSIDDNAHIILKKIISRCALRFLKEF